MADKTVILEVQLLEGNAQSKLDALRASVQGLDKTHKDYAPTLKLIAQAERDLSKVQQKRILIEKGLISSTTNVDKATKNTSKVLSKQSDATGSATAATMELSRVVSDAPYGIRGMANNITQLVSQLGAASTKAGGFGAALKLMGKQLMGPLGIVFAITAVVSALDYFFGEMKKTEESVDDTTSALEKQGKELIKLTNEYEKYLKIKEVVFQGAVKERELLASLTSATLDSEFPEDRRIIALNKLIKLYPKYFKGLKITDVGKLLQAEDSVNKILENRAKLKEAITDASIISNEIQLELIKKKADKHYKDNLVELYEEQKQARELIKIYSSLDLTLKNIDEKGDPRDKVYGLDLDSMDIGANKKKMRKVLDAVADAMGVDMKKDPLDIDTSLDLTLSPEAKKAVADALKAQVDEMVRQSKLEDLASYAEKAKEIIGGMGDFANAEFDRELTIEQNKTNALNNELNIRLQNENLSKEQRQSIQNQIAQNDEKLRVKQEQIERKRFTMQKAVNIAQATMDTFVAATGVLADTKGGSFARIAGMVATIGAGLAQVAMISRQKFQTSAGSSPRQATGSGGGGARAEPSFNIVGRSNDNILLSAIQSQFDKPLKAYVVARDVTNQQQLDGVISTSAST